MCNISIYLYTKTYINSAPSVPRELEVLTVTAASIEISWLEPARLNGVLQVCISDKKKLESQTFC